MPTQTDYLKKMSDAVVDMDEETVSSLCNAYLVEGYDVLSAIEDGLSDGMTRAGSLFEDQEYFVPELILCADAMYIGLNILLPHIESNQSETKTTVILGVAAGDVHDIGKNLVKTMLESSGCEVIDLGKDVSSETFISSALTNEADVIAISTLLTTTMDGMQELIMSLSERGLRSRFKVIVGGGPVSEAFSEKIGADGYAPNASAAAKLVKRLMGES